MAERQIENLQVGVSESSGPTMRTWPKGKAPGFHPGYAGSIPVVPSGTGQDS